MGHGARNRSPKESEAMSTFYGEVCAELDRINAYSRVCKELGLPECADKKKNLRTLIETWKQKSPVVADVLAGRYTFEEIVKPIVKENFRVRFPYYFNGACRSKEFQEQAKKLEERLKDVYLLGWWVTSTVEFPKFMFFMPFGMTVIASLVMFWMFISDARTESMANIRTFFQFLAWGTFLGALLGSSFAFGQGWMTERRHKYARYALADACRLDRALREAAQD